MLASPGPWRLGVAVALRSRSPQTAAELARSGSIRFYSILFYRVGADRIYIEVRPSVEVRTSIEVCCASIEDEVRLQATASLWRHRP